MAKGCKFSLYSLKFIWLYDDNDDDDNNSIQFFIIYVPIQQLQGQLQTQSNVHTSNYIMDKHYVRKIKD
jgi:hypothetical protein